MLRLIRRRVSMTTILLVDDNPLRASLRQAILERQLPEVIRVSDAAQALCLVEAPQFTAGLRLVVTGHPIFGISGPEFVAELRARLPHLPVLVLSTQASAEPEYTDIPDVIFSQASTPDDLRAVVKSILSTVRRQTA